MQGYFGKLISEWKVFTTGFFIGIVLLIVLSMMGARINGFSLGFLEIALPAEEITVTRIVIVEEEIEVTREVILEVTPIPQLLNETIPIAIDSTKDWQPTGHIVSNGTKIRIRVTGGEWVAHRRELSDEEKSGMAEDRQYLTTWVHYFSENPGSGSSTLCDDSTDCPIYDTELGMLVGKIGVSGEPFPIGETLTFTALNDGELYLRINDDDLSHNNGVLAVEILK